MSARGRHRRQRARRLSRISLMLTAGGAGVALPLVAAGGASAASQPAAVSQQAPQQAPQQAAKRDGGTSESYTVRSGDTLFRIADSHDVKGGWRALYRANREVLGGDPDLIHPGQRLTLDTKGYRASSSSSSSSSSSGSSDSTGTTETSSGFTAPVADPVISAEYHMAGSQWSSGYHTGVDFAASTGTQVVAVTSGEVVSAGYGGSAYGNEVVIRHDDGYYSQYAHLSSVSVSAGQLVTAGQEIGLVGSTGNATGPHLHFEIRTGPEYGSDVDPLAYLREHGVSI